MSEKIHGNKFDYNLVQYINYEIKVNIICNRCNQVFSQTPKSHLAGRGCPNCVMHTIEDFLVKSKKIHGNKFDYDLVKYDGSHNKICILCNQCNKVFWQSPRGHLRGNGCRHCHFDGKRLSQEEFILKSKNKHLDKYNYDLVEYINNITKVTILCKKCNKIFEQRPISHLAGRGCPICCESKGEAKVSKYLLENDISFIPQKTFKTLRDKNPLFADFYLDNFNLLIEYDGEYHYKAIRGSTPEIKQKNLEIQQRRDKIKNEWAKANNIPLLRIPYWDFDRIEELIDAFILQHTRKKETRQLVLEM
jgi:hypothetical protein